MSRDFTITHDLFVARDADWNYPFWVVDGNQPLDLSTATLELWVRPDFGHATLFHKLTSIGVGAEIVILNAAKGSAAIAMPQANVQAALPASPATGWAQFMRVVYGSGTIIEVWRGALNVRDGLVS